MRTLRAGVRLISLTLFTAFMVCVVATTRLAGKFAPRFGDRQERRAARGWARGMARILGLSVRHAGQPPQGRYLLISNHLSYIDILALMNVVDARFLSKAEVANWPGIGPVARFAGTLFVDRTRRTDLPRVIGEIEQVLASGRGVVFFPEGTSSSGFEVLPFKASLFEVAARGGLEVACATLRYETPDHERPAEWSVCWWGEMGFTPHFWQLLGLTSYEAQLRFSEARLSNSDRKLLAEEAREEVLRIFQPVCEVEPQELTPTA